MKISIIASLAAAAALVPSIARAQDAAVSSSTSSKTFLGASLQLLPVGNLAGDNGLGGKVSEDTSAAFAIGALGEYRIDSTFSIGFAPRYIFNVKGANANDSAGQVDLAVRLAAGGELAPKVRAYGFASPGYSWILPPSNGQGDTQHPNGLILGFGAGVAYEIAPKVALTGELGYQLGFQSFSVNGTSFDLHDNYLQLGLGIVAAVD